ncbi:MAG: hypothetical protein LQ342_002166 [Letrouitia transgressa]|nr:MAG: hypothetical protein LQ342_002166 [Letrouitia transgressa]
MPTSQLPSSASGPIPTFWTLTLTNFYTEVDAVTVSSNPTDSIKASTKTYSRLGLGGWNSSTTTSQQNLQSADLGSSVAYGTTKTVFANSTQSVRTNENSSASRLQRRQVGALVIATIEGQVVSWTNEYQGEHEATLVSSAIVTSKTFQSALTVPGSRFKVADSHSIYKCLPPSAAPISSVPQNTGELSQAASSVLQTPIISSSVMGSIIQTDVFASTTETLVPVYSNPTPSLAQTTQASLNASTTHPGFPTTTSSCPGIDRFTVDFDDLPHFATFTNNTDIPPIFNPYRKLYFSGGYGYVPPPSDPYPPISPPQLAVFNFYGNVSSNSPNAGLELDGEIGAGPRASESAYWIDAYSAWLGCANAGPLDCQIAILGYDAFNTRITSQTVRQPPCPGLQKCTLTQINFTDQFRELAGIQFEAFVDKKPVSFYMDDLSLGWSNNSCAAQTERSSAQ